MECKDKKCSIHGSTRAHGRQFVGTVTEAKSQLTATVRWERTKFLPKYERHEIRLTTVHAHNPVCINAKKGDKVKVIECRPLSKTKHFIISERIGADTEFFAKEQAKDEPVLRDTVLQEGQK